MCTYYVYIHYTVCVLYDEEGEREEEREKNPSIKKKLAAEEEGGDGLKEKGKDRRWGRKRRK